MATRSSWLSLCLQSLRFCIENRVLDFEFVPERYFVGDGLDSLYVTRAWSTRDEAAANELGES
jgi:hypothetical protein